MLATDLDPMMRAKGKHARTHAIMACLTNIPLRLPLVWANYKQNNIVNPDQAAPSFLRSNNREFCLRL